MKKRFSKDDDDPVEFPCKKEPDHDWNNSSHKGIKKKDQAEEYKCGNHKCNKFYHSYTAFYNHCKKTHDGQFPENSLINGRLFEGPSKNRGRPRITKIDTKNDLEIEAMKSENELIEFLGTICIDKVEEVIVYVQDPVEHLNDAIRELEHWKPEDRAFLKRLKELNRSLNEYDLPEFYDPTDASEQFPDKVDTYSFSSIVKFIENPDHREKLGIVSEIQNQHDGMNLELLRYVTVLWLGRIVSVPLLAEVIWVMMQEKNNKHPIDQKTMFRHKSSRFIEILHRFLKCYLKPPANSHPKEQIHAS